MSAAAAAAVPIATTSDSPFSSEEWPAATAHANILASMYLSKKETQTDAEIKTAIVAASTVPLSNGSVGNTLRCMRVPAIEPLAAPVFYVPIVIDQRPALYLGPFSDIAAFVLTFRKVLKYSVEFGNNRYMLRPTSELRLEQESVLSPEKNVPTIGNLPNCLSPSAAANIPNMKYATTFSVLELDPYSFHVPKTVWRLRNSRGSITRWLIRARPPRAADNYKLTCAELLHRNIWFPHTSCAWCVDVVWQPKKFWQARVIVRGVVQLRPHQTRYTNADVLFTPETPQQLGCYVWHPALWLALCNATPWPNLAMPVHSMPGLVYGFGAEFRVVPTKRAAEEAAAEAKLTLDDVSRAIERLTVGKLKREHEARLNSLRDALNGSVADLERLEQELSQVQQATVPKAIELSKAQVALERLNDTISKQIVEVAKALEPLLDNKDWVKKIAPVLEKLAQAHANLNNHALEILKTELDQLRTELAVQDDLVRRRGATIDALRKQLAEHIDSQTKIQSELDGAKTELEKRKKEVEQQRIAVGAANERARLAQIELPSLRQKVTELQSQCDQVGDDLRAARAQNGELEESIRELTAIREKLKARLKIVDAESTDQKADFDRVRAELDGVNTKLKETTTALEEVVAKYRKVSDENEGLEARLAQCQADLDAKTKEIKEQKQQLEKMTLQLRTVKQLEKNIEDLKGRLKESAQTNAELNNKLTEQEKAARQQQLALEQQTEALTESALDNGTKRLAIEELTAKLAVAIQERAGVEAEVNRQAIRLQVLQTALHTLTRQYDELTQKYQQTLRELKVTNELLQRLGVEYVEWAKTAREPRAIEFNVFRDARVRPAQAKDARAGGPRGHRPGNSLRLFFRIVQAKRVDADTLANDQIDPAVRLEYIRTDIFSDENRFQTRVYLLGAAGLPVLLHRRMPLDSLGQGSAVDWVDRAESFFATDKRSSELEAKIISVTDAPPQWFVSHDSEWIPTVVAWHGDDQGDSTSEALYPINHFVVTNKDNLPLGQVAVPRRGFFVFQDLQPYGLGGNFVYSLPRKPQFGEFYRTVGFLPAARVDIVVQATSKAEPTYVLIRIYITPHA